LVNWLDGWVDGWAGGWAGGKLQGLAMAGFKYGGVEGGWVGGSWGWAGTPRERGLALCAGMVGSTS
jgi:hypothetical protein